MAIFSENGKYVSHRAYPNSDL